jgi:hypothetical protein
LITATAGPALPAGSNLLIDLSVEIVDPYGDTENTGIEWWFCTEDANVPYYANAPTVVSAAASLDITNGSGDSLWLSLVNGDESPPGSSSQPLPLQGEYTVAITGITYITNVGYVSSTVTVAYNVES